MRLKILAAAATLVLVELALRRFAPRSRAYAGWKAFFERLGELWTAVLLAVVYFLSVSVVSALMRLTGNDPLDRRLDPRPSFWKTHEENPLGPEQAARHQF